MASFYDFKICGEGNNPEHYSQRIVYIESERKRLALARCDNYSIYWIISEQDLSIVTDEIKEKGIKPMEIPEKCVFPIFEAAKLSPKHPDTGARTLDAIVVEEFLNHLNNPTINN